MRGFGPDLPWASLREGRNVAEVWHGLLPGTKMSRAGHAQTIDNATQQGQSCASKRSRHFPPCHHAAADATSKH
jgi:hypothetical protein